MKDSFYVCGKREGSNLDSAFKYRGTITGDLNKGSNGGIKNGYYTIQSGNTITNGPGNVSWCTFIQFDSYSTQVVFSGESIYIRKYTGNPASWSIWKNIS